MGLEDIERFIETCKDFGYECHNKDRCELYFDYFPSKIIIVAREFSPIALSQAHEFMLEDKKLKKHFILSNHLKHIRHIGLHSRGPGFLTATSNYGNGRAHVRNGYFSNFKGYKKED